MRTEQEITTRIIEAILKDLSDRSGLGNCWENIDDETQLSIQTDWRLAIEKILSSPQEKPQPETKSRDTWDAALREARSLAVSLYEQHFKHSNPDWEPQETVVGLILQISNMVTAWEPEKPQPEKELQAKDLLPVIRAMIAYIRGIDSFIYKDAAFETDGEFNDYIHRREECYAELQKLESVAKESEGK